MLWLNTDENRQRKEWVWLAVAACHQGAKTKTQVRNLRQELKQTPWKKPKNVVYWFDLCGWLSSLAQSHLSGGHHSHRLGLLHVHQDNASQSSRQIWWMQFLSESLVLTDDSISCKNWQRSNQHSYWVPGRKSAWDTTSTAKISTEDNWESLQRCHNMLRVDINPKLQES